MQVYNDELYHYGKKGMKWGHRNGSGISSTHDQRRAEKKEIRRERKQMYKDQLAHPIHSTAAQIDLIKKHPLKSLNMDLETTKKLNNDVKRRIKDKSITREQVKTGAKKARKVLSIIGKNAIKFEQ